MSTRTGQSAEQTAAAYLQELGYRIMQRNWRTRFCEIDIVAELAGRVHFIEVKFRRSAQQGQAVEYVTPAKLKQMQRAALFWISEHDYPGDYQLDVVAVDGPQLTHYPNITQ